MKEEIANTLENAADNASQEAVDGPNGLQLFCAPFDEPPFDGLIVVLHGRFITVSCEGDSETIDRELPDWAEQAAEAILAIAGVA